LHIWQHVGVGVQGDVDVGVAHHLLHHLWVLPSLEHQRREGVSEVVEAHGGGQAGAFWEDALPCLQESLALAEQLPYPEAVRSGHGSLAEQELLQGKPEAALARLEPLVERSDPEELGVARLLPYLAWAYLELEDDDRAEDVVQGGIDRARAQGNRLTLVELLRVRGMVLARRRGWDEEERIFEEAVSIARSLRNPYAEARTLYERGLMCAGKLDPKQSREQFEAAAAIFQRLGSRPYSEMVQKAMAATG
jgi:tetratricopeptide (TPR) repeat protein